MKKSQLYKKLGNFVSVNNAPSRNGYNVAPNQFIIEFENGRVLQSYNSIVAGILYHDGSRERFVTEKHDYSQTTSRFVGQFLGMNLNERRNAIKCGDINLIDLED